MQVPRLLPEGPSWQDEQQLGALGQHHRLSSEMRSTSGTFTPEALHWEGAKTQRHSSHSEVRAPGQSCARLCPWGDLTAGLWGPPPTLQVQCHLTPHRLLMTENRFTPTPTGQPEGFCPDSATSSPGTRGLRVVWALTTLATLVPALPVAPPCVPQTPPFLRSQFHWHLQGATLEPGRKRQAFFQTLSH